MILDFPKNSIEDIIYFSFPIMELRTSSFHFHLTGSRFFEDHNSISDYDFFAQEGQEIENFLLDLGFKKIETLSYYNDDQIINVFRLRINNSWIDIQNSWIDIQLVKDVELKRIVQKTIKEKYFIQYLKMDKMQRRDLWNVLYYVCYNLLSQNPKS